MRRIKFDTDKELFLWGPSPGRTYYVTMFFDNIFNSLPDIYPKTIWPKTLFLFRDRRMVWINQMEELVEGGTTSFKTYMLPEEERSKMYALWEKTIEDSKSIFEEVEAAENLNDKEFIDLYNKFYDNYNEFWTHSVAPELGNYGAPSYLRSLLESYVPEEETDSVMEIMTAPTEPSFYQKEEFDLAKTDDIEKHAEKYFWLRNSYSGVKDTPVEFFEKKKEELNPDIEREVRKKLAEVEKKKEKVVKKYSLPEDTVRVSKVTSDNVVWQDDRKKHIFIYVHYQTLLAEEVARRTDTDFDAVLNLHFKELPDLLRGKELNAAERYEGIGLDSENQEEFIPTKEANQLWDKYTKTNVSEGTTKIKGIIASKGKVRGKVRIFLDPYEDFNDGDVLVTTMTSPEFVFAMKKSSAIVTNTGGLTSHAAIVARELDKPCIVGAKGVLEVFKDGDIVEVDADNGIVTKIS